MNDPFHYLVIGNLGVCPFGEAAMDGGKTWGSVQRISATESHNDDNFLFIQGATF